MKFELPKRKHLFSLEKEKLVKMQTDLLNIYYDVDEKHKTIKAKLYYEKASDILDSHYKKNIKLNDEIFQDIKEILENIPKDYKATILLSVKDKEGYTLSGLSDALEKKLYLKFYSTYLSVKRKRKQALSLTFIGVLLLTINVLLQILRPFGGAAEGIVSELVDIAAWVFVWEAVSLYYLDGYGMRSILKAMKKKIEDIQFIDEENLSEHDSLKEEIKEKIEEIKENL